MSDSSRFIGDADIHILLGFRHGRCRDRRHKVSVAGRTFYTMKQIGFADNHARIAVEALRRKAAVKRSWKLRILREGFTDVMGIDVFLLAPVNFGQSK